MKQQPTRLARAAGFSLVELLLALALGLLVVTGIVQLFVGNSQTYNVLNGQARMQESARFALDFISRAARSAGYFGCAVEQTNRVWGLVGSPELLPEFNVTRIVEGHDGVAGGVWNPSLTSLPRNGVNAYDPGGTNVGIDTSDIVEGTDVLVLRGMQRPGQRLAEVLQPDGNPVVIAPGGDPGFGVDDIVMVGNCEQAAVFRITGMPIAGDEATLLYDLGAGLHSNAAQVASPTGPTVDFTMSFIGRSYGPESLVGRIESTYFYIAEGAGGTVQGTAPLSLWQKVGRSAPVELIQGVEDLQVLYGVDTSDDGIVNANQYVTFDDLPVGTEASDVVALRVSVTVSSVDAVADGQVLRRTFGKTILLRNADPEAA
jgi:type IV pilus assembly protein PilW